MAPRVSYIHIVPQSFSILGGSSVGGGFGEKARCRCSGAFQYPRRIECGWWAPGRGRSPGGGSLSVSSADRVWVVARWSPVSSSATGTFQYPRRIECGWWSAPSEQPPAPPPLSVSSADRVWVVGISTTAILPSSRLSVSSADRVWVVATLSPESVGALSTFSILGGSSVGGGTGTPPPRRRRGCFQYPRRIECGWWRAV